MIEKLEIEKLQKGEMVDTFTFKNICLITNKINEIIDYLNNQKQSLNSLYGNSMKDYIKKEDLEKFIIQNKQDIQFYNENEESEYMKQFYNGIRYALNIIRVKFI